MRLGLRFNMLRYLHVSTIARKDMKYLDMLVFIWLKK